jgi:Probable transposase.
LAEWERDYAAGGKPNEAALRRKLNAIKGEQFPWMLEVSKRAPQQAIKNLGSAFKHFFRRCKQGEKKKGYPRFKKKGIHDSFRVDNGPPTPGENAVRIDAQHIQIPRLAQLGTDLKSVPVRETADVEPGREDQIMQILSDFSERQRRLYGEAAPVPKSGQGGIRGGPHAKRS